MKYELSAHASHEPKSDWGAIRSLRPLLSAESGSLWLASIATISNSLINLSAPLIIAYIVDNHIANGQFAGIWRFGFVLLGLYAAGLFTSYSQTRLMGGVGQRVLFNLRSKVFNKLQELPVAFFHANKTGDLISRINHDTDKLNQFFSQTLVQFVGSVVIMAGAAIFLLAIELRLAVAALLPALSLLVFTRLVASWVKRRNTVAAASTGELSAEVSESLSNFKAVVAFNRRDFFRQRFAAANEANYRNAVFAGIANNLYMPVFGLASNLAQLVTLVYGIHLIVQDQFTIGMLIGCLAYVTNFYNPLRQIASQWANFQVAMASWDRVSAILQMENDMLPASPTANHGARQTPCILLPENDLLPASAVESDSRAIDEPLLEFQNVSFKYSEDQWILRDVSFELKSGRVYAMVGPTGGGKTTTASLMARLYDPSEGTVLLGGQDIRLLSSAERARKIGFILQEPMLFSGTIRENILYGNAALAKLTTGELAGKLDEAGLSALLKRFDGGLDCQAATSGDALSLGQRQLIAFMRAVLRDPDLLILDEATANIDTITEQLLETILRKLPSHTALVIIAHRLNTIENADEIFFVNGTQITPASGAGGLSFADELRRSQADTTGR